MTPPAPPAPTHPAARYGLAIAAALAAISLPPAIGPAPETVHLSLAFAAVALAARFGGPGPSLLALALVAAPRLLDARASDAIPMLSLAVVAAFIASLQHDRRRARLSADEEHSRFQAMSEAVPSILFTGTPDGSIDYFSPALQQFTGADPSQALGHGWVQFVHQDDVQATIAAVQHTLQTADAPDVRIRFRDRDGSYRWHLVRRRALRDPSGRVVRWFGAATDIDDLERAQQALALREERFRLASEAVRALIYDHDLDSGHVDRSAGLLELTGYRPDEATPSLDWWRSLILPDDLPRIDSHIAEAHRGNGTIVETEYRVHHRDGSTRDVWDRGRLVRDDAGRLVRIVGSVLDISQIRHAEELLRLADRRKDDFLAILGHELRNPIASIGNAARLLSHPDTGADRLASSIEVIERQVGLVTRIVEDLLDASRISRGKFSLQRQRTDLASAVRRAADSVAPLILDRRHRLEVSCEPNELWVWVDPARIEQLIVNLLTNAAKYTEPGGRISLSARLDGDSIAIAVRDDGIGLAPEHLPFIFDLYSQLDSPQRPAPGGLGIGLTLVRRIVEMHGGTVQALSDGPGQGTEFIVRIPASTPRGPSPAPAQAIPSTGRPLQDTRILVVDDNVDSAWGLAWLLQAHGADVETVEDGLLALEAAARQRPDAILLDIGLPGLNGYQVAPEIRKLPGLEHVAIVAVTGYGQENDRLRSREAGFDEHLVKPVELAHLLAVLDSLLHPPATPD